MHDSFHCKLYIKNENKKKNNKKKSCHEIEHIISPTKSRKIQVKWTHQTFIRIPHMYVVRH